MTVFFLIMAGPLLVTVLSIFAQNLFNSKLFLFVSSIITPMGLLLAPVIFSPSSSSQESSSSSSQSTCKEHDECATECGRKGGNVQQVLNCANQCTQAWPECQ